MLALTPQAIQELPLDQLALAVLRDYLTSKTWSEHNYQNDAQRELGVGPHIQAISEAQAWLRSHGLIADEIVNKKVFVTRLGLRVVDEGSSPMYAAESLQATCHPAILDVARPQFLIGQPELGVFASLRAIEIRVRELGAFSSADHGVDLMNKAFGPSGLLTDTSAAPGEQQGTRSLFAGAYAVLRNPSGHRQVDFDELAEAAEAVHTASMLMRILDRVEARLAK